VIVVIGHHCFTCSGCSVICACKLLFPCHALSLQRSVLSIFNMDVTWPSNPNWNNSVVAMANLTLSYTIAIPPSNNRQRKLKCKCSIALDNYCPK
jgi:hypothetical protein